MFDVHVSVSVVYSRGLLRKIVFWASYLSLHIHRKDFEHYAYTCFKAFGDRVKHWITFNEPHNFALHGYDLGIQAPGRCSLLGHLVCKKGKSSTEPYIVAHNILLSHAAAYRSYQLHFKVPSTSYIQLITIKKILPALHSLHCGPMCQIEPVQRGWFNQFSFFMFFIYIFVIWLCREMKVLPVQSLVRFLGHWSHHVLKWVCR